MEKHIINGHSVTVYSSIDEMPIVNFSRFGKFMLIDSGIGSTLEDIDLHIEKILRYVVSKPEVAIQELYNMRQSLYYVNQGVNTKNLAFASLISEIDGVKLDNISDDFSVEVLKSLDGENNANLHKLLEELKKKIEYELFTYFPSMQSNSYEKETYDLLKRRTTHVLDSIISGEDNTAKIETIDNMFFNAYKPKSFIGNISVEVQYIKDFESACLLLTKETGINAKSMTVLQFYLALEQMKVKSSKQPKKIM